MSTGSRIKECRMKAGLTVEYLANQLGKDRATIYRYESGAIDDIPVSVVTKIAKILRVSPTFLIGWNDSEEDVLNEVVTPEEKELLTLYRKSSDLIKETVLWMLREHPQQK